MSESTEPTTVRDYAQHVDTFQEAAEAISDLSLWVANGLAQEHQFETALNLLTRLPLTTDDFALAKQQLRNGRRALAEGEPHAGAYELGLLARRLKGNG